MTITTLRTGSLTLSAVEYKFDANKRLSIKLTTDGAHKLYGDVNIILANVLSISIYDNRGALIENFFNNNFSFSAISSDTLEYSQVINSGVEQSETFVALADNGSDITATVDNDEIQIPTGKYTFKLIATEDTVFDGALVTFQELNIASIGEASYDGVMDFFAETTAGNYQTVDNQELTFQFEAKMALSNKGSNTNIPILFI